MATVASTPTAIHGESSVHSMHSSESDETLSVVEIKGDQVEADSINGQLNLTGVDMWAMGVTITVAGIFFAWNAGLEAGFGSYIIARFLITSAYISLVLCISELSSGLPFAGNLC